MSGCARMDSRRTTQKGHRFSCNQFCAALPAATTHTPETFTEESAKVALPVIRRDCGKAIVNKCPDEPVSAAARAATSPMTIHNTDSLDTNYRLF
eukprot:6184358-Pleurochrysis_carterae.AAC.1